MEERRRIEQIAIVAMASALALSPAYVIRFHVGLPTTLLEIILVVAIALGLAAHARTLPWRNPYLLGTLVLLAGATVDAFVSPDRRAAFGIWKAYFVEPALAGLVIAALVRTRDDMRWLLGGLAVAGSIVAAAEIGVALHAIATGHFRVIHPPVAIYNTPNAVPLYLVPLAAFSIPFALYSDARVERWAAAVFTGLAAVAVIVSYSRAGWLALIVVAVFAAAWHPKKARVLAGVAAAVAVALLVPSIRRRVAIELDPHNPDNTINLRIALWKSTLNLLRHHPLFGGGLSGFQRSLEPFRDPSYREQQIYPHNIVLNFWTETGLLGLLGFLLLCIALVRQARQGLASELWVRMLSIGLLGLLLGFLVHGIADVPYFKNDQALAFWALLGIQLGAVRASLASDSGSQIRPTTPGQTSSS